MFVTLIVMVILVALAWFVIESLVSDPKIKNILRVILVVLVVLGGLEVLGLLPGGWSLRR